MRNRYIYIFHLKFKDTVSLDCEDKHVQELQDVIIREYIELYFRFYLCQLTVPTKQGDRSAERSAASKRTSEVASIAACSPTTGQGLYSWFNGKLAELPYLHFRARRERVIDAASVVSQSCTRCTREGGSAGCGWRRGAKRCGKLNPRHEGRGEAQNLHAIKKRKSNHLVGIITDGNSYTI